LASRTVTKLGDVAKAVEQSSGIQPHTVQLDLGSYKSIRQAAASIQKLVTSVDVLINNAAVVSSERQETVEGLEQTFGTNHIGHFMFTSLLMSLLQTAPNGSRVVNVTSLGYRLSPIRFHDYNFSGNPVPPEEEPPASLPPHMKPNASEGRPYHGFSAYGQSKTANILHCVSLNDKYRQRGLRAFAVHPGSIWTELSRNLTPEDLKIIEGTSTQWINQDQGTATILVAAFDPHLARTDDQVLLAECQLIDAAPFAKDPAIADKLWKLSEQLTSSAAKI
jgi:NAD(P)-dependent dehydrogenase (short-subunit alcohol dehydrogenase family)